MSDRRGFALVAVLWVVVAAGALALVARLAARELVASTGNRTALAQARWAAEGCQERARATIDRALRAAANEGPGGPTWPALDSVVAQSPLMAGCRGRMVPVGARLDVNSADAEMLRRLFLAAQVPPARADSLVDAVLDWRDADDEARPLGAESVHYARAGAAPPRNGPFADPRELSRVRGMAAGMDTLLGVDSARIALSHAPAAVLMALPGMSADAVRRLLALRARDGRLTELATLEAGLAPGPRLELLREYARLSGLTAAQPDGWTLEFRASAGEPAVTAVTELRVVRAGGRAAVVRKRTWME